MDTAGPAVDQGSGPGSAAPPSGWKQRRWEAGRWAQQGTGRRAAVVGEGKTEAYSMQTEYREARLAGAVYREKL